MQDKLLQGYAERMQAGRLAFGGECWIMNASRQGEDES
jgi:hypothetical protein